MKFFTVNATLLLLLLNLDVHPHPISKSKGKLPPITCKLHCDLRHINSSLSEESYLYIHRYRQGRDKRDMVAGVYSKGQVKTGFDKGLTSVLVSGALEFGKGFLSIILPTNNKMDKEWLHDEYQCVAGDFKTESERTWESGLVSCWDLKFDCNYGKRESDPPGLVVEVESVLEGETSASFRDCNKTPNCDHLSNKDSNMKLDKTETESLLSFLNDDLDVDHILHLNLTIPPVKYKLHCNSDNYNSSLSEESEISIQSSRQGQGPVKVARVYSSEEPTAYIETVSSMTGSLKFGKGFLEVTIGQTNIEKIGEYQCVVIDFKTNSNTSWKLGSFSPLDPEGNFKCGKIESNPPGLVLEMECMVCLTLTGVITAPFCDVDQNPSCQHTVNIRSLKTSGKTENIKSFLNHLPFVLICVDLSSSRWYMTPTLPSSGDLAKLKPKLLYNCSFVHNISIYQCKIIPKDEDQGNISRKEGTIDVIWQVVVASLVGTLIVLIFLIVLCCLQKKFSTQLNPEFLKMQL